MPQEPRDGAGTQTAFRRAGVGVGVVLEGVGYGRIGPLAVVESDGDGSDARVGFQVDDHEAPAADAAGVGADDGEGEGGRDGGVDGVAPLTEDVGAGAAGEGVVRGDAGFVVHTGSRSEDPLLAKGGVGGEREHPRERRSR